MKLPARNLPRKGFFVGFEGLDGSGKSTVTQLINAQLQEQGHPSLLTREPGSTAFGKEIRNILQYTTQPISAMTEVLLFAADRSHHIEHVVKPALDNNQIVLSDRTYISSLVYQTFQHNVPLEDVIDINLRAMQGCVPDLVIFLDLPLAESLARLAARGDRQTRFEERQITFFQQLREGYLHVMSMMEQSLILDARRSPEDLSNIVIQKILSTLRP